MRKLKLHTKFIVLFSGVALVPLIIVSVFTLVRFQQSLLTDASKLSAQVAANASAQIQTFLVLQFETIDNMASLYVPGFPVQKDAAAQILEQSLLNSQSFNDISVVGKNGKEIARANRSRTFSDSDFRDMSSSTAFVVVQNYGIYVGSVYGSADGKSSYFDVGRAIVDKDGNFAGAVLAQVDAQSLGAFVDSFSRIVEAPGRVFIVDQTGIVIAGPDIQYMISDKNLSMLPPVHSIVARPDQVPLPTAYTNELGIPVLGAAYPLLIPLSANGDTTSPGLNWFVVTELPESSIYAEERSAALFAALIVLFGMVLAACAAIFIAGRISKPIDILHKATVEFGKGNLAYRADVKTGDEIEDLATSFNTTAGALAATVSSLKNEEQVTAAERNKLRLILAGITNAVVAVDTDRNVILFNKAAETLTGYATAEVLGKPVQEIIKLRSNASEITVDTYCPAAGDSEGPVFSENNLTLRGKGDKEYVVNLVSGRIHGGMSINLGCVLTFQDVTREFAMEKTRREFVSIAAHQLRTPLTGMSWVAELLLSGAKGALNAAQKELVGKSADAVHRMVELVNDLLDVSRIEEGRFGVKLTLQSISPVLERSLDTLLKEAQLKHIEISTDVHQDLPPVYADANKLEFAFDNIFDNAIKYTSPGGKVAVSAERKGNEIVVSVKDTGMGISRADFGRVFTKFFRSREALSRFTDGTGLGLYVAKNIVNQHGGEVRFESEEGTGTTFFISLPISRPVPPDQSVGANNTESAQGNT